MSRCWMIFQSDFCVNVNYFWALRQAVRETFLCAGLSHARVPMTIFSAFNDNICHSILIVGDWLWGRSISPTIYAGLSYKNWFQSVINFTNISAYWLIKLTISSVNFINNLCATLWHGKINSIIESILLIISAHYFLDCERTPSQAMRHW